MQPRDVSRFDEVRIAINVLDPLRLLFIVEIVGGCKENSFQPVSEETLFFNCFRIGPLSPIFVRFFFYWRKTRGDMQIKIMFRCYSIFQMARNLIFCMFFFLNLICKFDQLSQKVLDIW